MRSTLHRGFKDALRSVTLVNPALPTTLGTWRNKFYVYLHVRERDSGEPVTIRLSYNIPDPPVGYTAYSRDAYINWIYSTLRLAWVHELNEALWVDGKRRRDLHDEHGRTVTPPEDIAYE